MTSYASDHASASADVRAAGAAVTFTRTSPGTEQLNGTFDGASATTIFGAAIAKRGDPARYAALGLTLAQAVTLLFVPVSSSLLAFSSAFVRPGDLVTWDLPGGLTHIGIVSDRKNVRGVPLILHNIGPVASEADCLRAWPITGHFRVKV